MVKPLEVSDKRFGPHKRTFLNLLGGGGAVLGSSQLVLSVFLLLMHIELCVFLPSGDCKGLVTVFP